MIYESDNIDELKRFGPAPGSVAATIKSKMEGGSIFGGDSNQEGKDSLK